MALNELRAFIQKVHVQGKRLDTLALDRNKVTAIASSLYTRWQDVRDKAGNLFNLRQQL